MAMKICPECQSQNGPRTLKCGCGYIYNKSTKKNTTSCINLGSWINDTTKGMPKIDIPEPLPTEPKKLDIDEIAHYIVHEGLGYCVLDYIPSGRIADAGLVKLWKETKKKMVEIVKYVEKCQNSKSS